jgi:hypothetical protein
VKSAISRYTIRVSQRSEISQDFDVAAVLLDYHPRLVFGSMYDLSDVRTGSQNFVGVTGNDNRLDCLPENTAAKNFSSPFSPRI